jgi:dTDP-glucose pyrophosphorylase
MGNCRLDAGFFYYYLYDELRDFKTTIFIERELLIKDIINMVIQDGLRVEAVHVSDKPFIDIGTSEDLARAVRCFMHLSNR